MSNAGTELLKDVLEHPEDDEVRLIYADWLMDNGDEERGEFIIDSVELAKLQKLQAMAHGHGLYVDQGCRVCDGVVRLQLKVARGVRENRYKWTGIVAEGGDVAAYRFERGFLAGLKCPLEQWVSRGPKIVRSHPIERVEIDHLFGATNIPDYASRWVYCWRDVGFPDLRKLQDEIAEGLRVELNATIREAGQNSWPWNVDDTHLSKAVSVPVTYSNSNTIKEQILNVFSRVCLAWARRQDGR